MNNRKTMNYSDINYLDYQANQLIENIKQIMLNGSGICVIQNFPISDDNQSLINLSELLGSPISEERNIDNKTIYRVEVNKDMEIPTYANTEYEFWCHTDCSDFEVPPDVVLLLCEIPSITGGDTFVLHVNELQEKFSNLEMFMLSHKAYPFRGYYLPILSLDSNNNLNIRYNRISIDFCLKIGKLQLEEKYLNLLDKLDSIINELKFPFKLKKSECLITNNRTILHGRSAFPVNEARLMKRIRLYLN